MFAEISATEVTTHPLTIMGAFGVLVLLVGWVVRQLISTTIPSMQLAFQAESAAQRAHDAAQVENVRKALDEQRKHDSAELGHVREAAARQNEAVVSTLVGIQNEITDFGKMMVTMQATSLADDRWNGAERRKPGGKDTGS